MKTSVTFATATAVFLLVSIAAAQSVESDVRNDRGMFGISMSAGLVVKSGRACAYGYSSGGMVQDAKVARKAQHGNATVPDSSYEYRSKPGHTDADAFVIEATGRDTSVTGSLVLTCEFDFR